MSELSFYSFTIFTFECATIELPIYQNQLEFLFSFVILFYRYHIPIPYGLLYVSPEIYYNIVYLNSLKMVGVKRNKQEKFLTESAPPSGDSDKFSTVALSSSTLADIGADPLFSGFIST